MKRALLWILGLALSGAMAGAEIIQYGNPSEMILVRMPATPNPTSWVFAVPINRVRQAMIERRVFGLLPRWVAYTKPEHFSDARERVLRQPGNEQDGYLCSRPGDASVRSTVYFLPDKTPCLFGVEMHIHLTALDADRTKVEVIPHRPWVYAGERERGVTALYWRRQAIFVKAAATTIEEYTVLRNLGAALGVTDMPPVRQPDPGSALKEYRYSNREIIDLNAPTLYEMEWAPKI